MNIKTFSEYCKEIFGGKVYRLSLSAGCTCPNRDGTVGVGGCSFCSEKGAGEFAAKEKSIGAQMEEAKKRIENKIPKSIRKEEMKYIAYFQSFTNTYGNTDKLRKIFTEAIEKEEIVALSIATRPDCLKEDKLNLLSELNRTKPVWVELGLQTINEECAQKFNRGYSLPVFENAYKKLNELGLTVIVHVILGLPYEKRKDALHTVAYLSKLSPPLSGIKLHLLHVLKNTKLAKEYEEHTFPVMSMEEYTDLVVKCLKILPETTVIHRMTGDGERKSLIEPQWSLDKKRVLNTLTRKIAEAVRE